SAGARARGGGAPTLTQAPAAAAPSESASRGVAAFGGGAPNALSKRGHMTRNRFGLASLAVVACGVLAFAQQAPPAPAPAAPGGRGAAVAPATPAAPGAPAPGRQGGRGGGRGGAP